MKTTFTTVDLMAIVGELKEKVVGMRVAQVYDVDNKTYLIKLQKPDHKCVLLLESGARIHTTEYEWPKNPAPSGFSMKLRKHLRNKRVEAVNQLGVDRIVNLQFGSGEAEHHLLLELYDRGNLVLTDGSYTILNILRPRREGEDVRFAVHEKYPIDSFRSAKTPLSLEELQAALSAAKPNLALKKILNPYLDCGGGVLDHELLEQGFALGTKLSQLKLEDDLPRVHSAVTQAQTFVTHWLTKPSNTQGFITKKVEEKLKVDGSKEEVAIFQDFLPRLFSQYLQIPHDTFSSFNQACDEFFSKMEAVKIEQKAIQKEREVLKKLDNVKADHQRRLQELDATQKLHELQGHQIELNKDLVDGAILVVRSAVANQIDWRQIQEILDEAQARNDPVATCIKELKLATNSMSLLLSNPYDYDEDDLLLDSDEEREEGNQSTNMRPIVVEIDLGLSAMANARRYFDQRRQAARKELKTISASEKLVQLTTKKTSQTLKEVQAVTNINKARKVLWFEKHLWFISSENYLVLGGRDSQTNELLVKRHLRATDVYVHADMHGAPSVVIKNPSGKEPPPKTLHEAGIMALCYSRAWDEKVVTSAWWVWGSQVSKTAPTGEYLTTGAFMVRGKKNFLPPSHLIYGFGFLFRLEEDSIARHAGERKVRAPEDTNLLEGLQVVVEEADLDLEDLPDEEEEANTRADMKEEENEKASQEEASEVTVKEEITENTEKETGGGEEDEEEKEEDSDDAVEFPDTVVEMAHLKGDQFSVRTRTVSTTSQVSIQSGGTAEEDSVVVYLGDDKPVIVSKNRNKEKGKAGKKVINPKPVKEEETETCESGDGGRKVAGAVKRGQKSKMKKMKKYQDQDEEERAMRMQLLQSAGSNKEKKGKAGKKGAKEVKGNPQQRPVKGATKPAGGAGPSQESAHQRLAEGSTREDQQQQEEAEDDDEPTQVADDLNIINALTAMPVTVDELLYAIPVCAPYSTMTNYKYKVKLMPGPGKKGKACKTALALFMADKTATGREKDLLRAVRDQDLAKNLPGKVKVSAPNITKVKK